MQYLIKPAITALYFLSLTSACNSASDTKTSKSEKIMVSPTEEKSSMPEKKPVAPAKTKTPTTPALAAYEISPGSQIGPLYLGMSRAEVESLDLLQVHPQYAAMTVPYSVHYEDDVLVNVQLSLLHADEEVRVGTTLIPKTSTMEQAAALIGECDAPDVRFGGTSISCLGGAVIVSVGSGNVKEVWLQIHAPSAD